MLSFCLAPTRHTSLFQISEILKNFETRCFYSKIKKVEVSSFFQTNLQIIDSLNFYLNFIRVADLKKISFLYLTCLNNVGFTFQQKEPIIVNYVPFGEKAITMMVNLYQQTARVKAVIKGNILTLILEVRILLFRLEQFLHYWPQSSAVYYYFIYFRCCMYLFLVDTIRNHLLLGN